MWSHIDFSVWDQPFFVSFVWPSMFPALDRPCLFSFWPTELVDALVLYVSLYLICDSVKPGSFRFSCFSCFLLWREAICLKMPRAPWRVALETCHGPHGEFLGEVPDRIPFRALGPQESIEFMESMGP
jgi:hypothetical protein